jgi:hypothetical protein
VPSKEQVKALIAQGLDYPEIGRRLGVPPGQAYLIGTGRPADGSHRSGQDAPNPNSTDEPDSRPPYDNPTNKQVVLDWVARRVADDEQMRSAGAARKAQERQ